VARSGLELLPPAAGGAAPGVSGARRAVSADPFEGLADVREAFHGVVAAGGPARFAVFAAAGAGSLREAGSAACVATVIGGRLLHRRR
jgi:hypothetical protein